jgi:hypothetical protein
VLHSTAQAAAAQGTAERDDEEEWDGELGGTLQDTESDNNNNDDDDDSDLGGRRGGIRTSAVSVGVV